MSHTTTREEVTVRLAVSRLVEGLRQFAAVPNPEAFIGHPAAAHAESGADRRRKAALARQRQAADLADRLDEADDAEALELLRTWRGELPNWSRYHLGPWAHVAAMVGSGARYDLVGGVLCQVAP